MKAARKDIIHTCILVIVGIFVAIATARIEDIYTYIWHMKNPDAVRWYEYSIKIPHDLVAKSIGDRNNEKLIIYSMKIPKEIYIRFSKIGRLSGQGINTEKRNIDPGIRMIEKKDSVTMGEESITIKSVEKDNPGKYYEQVYLRSSDTMILFIGKNERCYVMSEIINNMKRIQYRTI